MYISRHIIDVLPVDHHLRQTCSCKDLYQFLACSPRQRHRHNLVARYHAFGNLGVLEINRFSENLHLILHSFAVLPVFHALLDIVVKLIHGKTRFGSLTRIESAEFHQPLGYHRDKPGYGIKNQIDKIEGQSQKTHHEIRIDAECCLGKKFSEKEDNGSRENSIRN